MIDITYCSQLHQLSMCRECLRRKQSITNSKARVNEYKPILTPRTYCNGYINIKDNNEDR